MYLILYFIYICDSFLIQCFVIYDFVLILKMSA